MSYCVVYNNNYDDDKVVQGCVIYNHACSLARAQSSKAYEAGQTDLAKAHARRARLYTFTSLAVGIVSENVIFIILIIIVAR